MIDLEKNTIERIEAFIKTHNTAILSIMFTDIKGFTEFTTLYGEQKSKELRHKQDQILFDIIEGDYNGLIIKQIGDSVLAVFIEPSMAVRKALAIQNKIKETFFSSGIKGDPYYLKLRIGIHMGQVSVENNLMPDIFGDHVNKASRIMHLADGGQILLSKGVHDSARTWLMDPSERRIFFKKHGSVILKGTLENEIIYEVLNDPEQKFKVPFVIKRKRVKRSIILITICAIVIVPAIFLVKKLYYFNSISHLPVPYQEAKKLPGHPALINQGHLIGGVGGSGGALREVESGANGTKGAISCSWLPGNGLQSNSYIEIKGPFNFSDYNSLSFFCKGNQCDSLKVIFELWTDKIEKNSHLNTTFFEWKNKILLTDQWRLYTLPFNTLYHRTKNSLTREIDLKNIITIYFESSFLQESGVFYVDEVTVN